ncbi:MAG: hypothetical protein P8Y66_08405 [Nitrospirota bacterium]
MRGGKGDIEAYRYQEFLYLVVPVVLGLEFFATGRDERAYKAEAPLGSYFLDFFGFIFISLIPALFIFTIWAVETHPFNIMEDTLARFDRYGVMFMFLGAWWQVYIIGALRVHRMRKKQDFRQTRMWGPFLGLGFYISFLVLWVSPWNMKWASVLWFALLAAIMGGLRVRPQKIEKTLWILAAITFFLENIIFAWLEAVV